MTTLLDSHTHHCCIRILSCKVLESSIHDEDPPRRQIPANTSHSPATRKDKEELTAQQCSQRECQQKEKSTKQADELNSRDQELPNK
jgi:hypothetical protein